MEKHLIWSAFAALASASAIALVACGGSDGAGDTVASAASNGTPSASADDFDMAAVNMSPQSFSDASAGNGGTHGFVAKALLAASRTLSTDASAADAVVINAESADDVALAAAAQALSAHKLLIVDSSGSEAGQEAVAGVLAKLLGGASMKAPAVTVADLGHRHYTVAPLQEAASSGRTAALSAGDAPVVDNSVANVLGLAVSTTNANE